MDSTQNYPMQENSLDLSDQCENSLLSNFHIKILVLITCCTLKNAVMNSKLLDNFRYDLIEAQVKYLFEVLSTLFRKLTSNDINPRIFSIEKTKKCFFFQFFIKNTPNIISKFNDDFSEDFLRYYTYL